MPLDYKTVHAMVYDIMSDAQRKAYEEFLEGTFPSRSTAWRAFASTPSTRTVARAPCSDTIPSKILTLEQLNTARRFLPIWRSPRGLVLVTGPHRVRASPPRWRRW